MEPLLFKVLTAADLERAMRQPSPEYRARKTLAAELTIKARNLDSAWGPQSSNRVENRGERLHKIIWQGRQWAATKYGVECRDGGYAIERARLWEEDESYSWVMHMAGKGWVDLKDFAEALRVARILELCRTGRHRPPRRKRELERYRE
jgi:hypothetical protein